MDVIFVVLMTKHTNRQHTFNKIFLIMKRNYKATF